MMQKPEARIVYQVAGETGLDPRSVRDVFAGRRVRASTRIAVVNALRRLGLEGMLSPSTDTRPVATDGAGEPPAAA